MGVLARIAALNLPNAGFLLSQSTSDRVAGVNCLMKLTCAARSVGVSAA